MMGATLRTGSAKVSAIVIKSALMDCLPLIVVQSMPTLTGMRLMVCLTIWLQQDAVWPCAHWFWAFWPGVSFLVRCSMLSAGIAVAMRAKETAAMMLVNCILAEGESLKTGLKDWLIGVVD